MSRFDDLEYASLTDVGVRRSHNQDNHAVLPATDELQWQQRGHIFLIADGMGGHAVGELASEQAVSVIPHLYEKYAAQGTMPALRKAFVEANASIHSRGQQNTEFEGMGTTATALVLRPDGAWIGHVGDSRCYRVREGKIEQLSFDHSWVWEYARRQKIDPDKVHGISSNVLIRSLGPEPLVAVDIEGVHPIRAGDVFVLCSDGLSGLVSDAEIGAVVSVLAPTEACRLLIDLANLRGGPDNITVIVVRAGPGLTTVPEPAVPLLRRLPWALLALLIGALLAGAATTATMHQLMMLGVFTFVLAAIAVGAGVVGLLSYHAREKREAAANAERPRPKIHRSHACQVERSLLDKLAHAAQNLKAQTEEKGWEVDWRAFEVNYNSAEISISRGALVEACREYCRALQTLLDAMRGQRHRGEVFQPNWDRKEHGANGK